MRIVFPDGAALGDAALMRWCVGGATGRDDRNSSTTEDAADTAGLISASQSSQRCFLYCGGCGCGLHQSRDTINTHESSSPTDCWDAGTLAEGPSDADGRESV